MPDLDRCALPLVDDLDMSGTTVRSHRQPDLSLAVKIGVIHQLADNELDVVERGRARAWAEMPLDQAAREGAALSAAGQQDLDRLDGQGPLAARGRSRAREVFVRPLVSAPARPASDTVAQQALPQGLLRKT